MAVRPLIYVHGAGAQQPVASLKHQLDQVLFGQDMATTRVGHYSDVRWPPPGSRGPRVGPERGTRARRSRVIGATTHPGVSPKAAAAAIVESTLLLPPAARGRRNRGVAPDTEPPAPPPADAYRLVEQLYRRADRIAERSAAPRPVAVGISFPDPIFRWVIGRFASDVIDYLYGPFKKPMQEPVRKALLDGPPPAVIVAHSLGTIVLYDVLSEPAFAGLSIELVTVGCPLGIANVQDELRDRAGRPNPVPRSVKAWANYADRWDPVAIDPTLRDDFTPIERSAKDERVNNPAPDNHDLLGYLSVAMVRATIVAAAG